MIFKNFDSTIDWLEELRTAPFFETSGYDFLLPLTPVKKLPTNFTLPFTIKDSSIYFRFQNKMPAFDFGCNGKSYHVPENDSYYKHLSTDIISNTCKVDLYLNRFSSVGFDPKENHFHRYITPISNNPSWRGLVCLTYVENRRQFFFHLMSLTLPEGEVHIGLTERKNDENTQRYFFIEPQFECTACYVGNIISFPIILALGLLQGDVHLNESYLFQYDNLSMDKPLAVEHRALCESYHYDHHLVDSNPYPYLEAALKPYKGNGKDVWIEDQIHKIAVKYNNFVPISVINNLVEMMITHDDLLSATHILMSSISVTLEMQPAVCAVVMETLTGHVMSHYKLKAPNQVDPEHWNCLRKQLLAGVEESAKGGKLDEEELKFVKNKINNLNQPTNADKLKLPFRHFGYDVTPEEFENAINNRNLLLHGRIGVNMADIQEASQKLLFITMLFHRLCGVLLLKMAGYEGYIINYPKVYGMKSRRKLFISLK